MELHSLMKTMHLKSSNVEFGLLWIRLRSVKMLGCNKSPSGNSILSRRCPLPRWVFARLYSCSLIIVRRTIDVAKGNCWYYPTATTVFSMSSLKQLITFRRDDATRNIDSKFGKIRKGIHDNVKDGKCKGPVIKYRGGWAGKNRGWIIKNSGA